MSVRVGIIGVGAYAQRAHLPQLIRHPDALVHAACRRNPARLAEAADAFGIECRYARIDDLLADSDLDAVTISLPHDQHFAVARDALRRDLHVLVDKPMALRRSEAVELRELAAARGRVLMVGFNRHYEPPFNRAKEALESGAFGQVRFIDGYMAYDWDLWLERGEQRFSGPHAQMLEGVPAVQAALLRESDFRADAVANGGGYFADGGAHIVDACLWLSDQPATRVFAIMDSPTADLYSTLSMRLASGALCSVACVGEAPLQRDFRLSVYCQNGALHLRWGELTLHRTGQPPEVLTNDDMTFDGSHVENFIDVILGRAEPSATAVDGERQVAVMEAAYRSARDGVPVDC